MSAGRLEQIMRDAAAAGMLPAGAALPVQDVRPWPLVLMSAFGAWLAALPLLLGLGLILGDRLEQGAAAYVLGIAVLLGAVVTMRSRKTPLFVEQLAVPALLVGGGLLAFGLFRDWPVQGAAGALALIALGVAWLLPRDWLRVLLGALTAGLLALVCLPGGRYWYSEYPSGALWNAWHICLAVWIAAHWLRSKMLNDGAGARHAAALESLGAGWMLAVVAGLALWSGMTFMLGASLGGGAGELAYMPGPAGASGWHGALSVGLAVCAALWLARAWPSLRQLPGTGVALVLIGLAWCMPALGAVWLALAFCAASGRWRVAVAAGLAAAWIVGSFYYQLYWPLATKAALLAGAGLALGGLSWLAARGAAGAVLKTAPAAGVSRKMQAGVVLCLLAVLAAANGAIWQKENLIAHGQPVYVALTPADPRSLMQGDYMQLNFLMPEMRQGGGAGLLSGTRPHLVAKRDARGIAALLRRHDGAPLAPGEFLFELTPRDGGWMLVSDAWFFKEGEAERWSRARYGEFRVAPDGRALLVGLRGENLAPL